ncbi:MAG: hypothetical protein BWK76_08330 [Desulfobulbaceae bacterium A2]|nr:MAG: hypothetical protein BWK76_08330 [Desulfobulbaceae bacterium A2]
MKFPALHQAQRLILARLVPVGTERVMLTEAAGRVTPVAIRCQHPHPAFHQSTRDGFALGPVAPSLSSPQLTRFRLVGEVAAGSLHPPRLGTGKAVRIMTGALLPEGAVGVMPLELCREQAGQVEIATSALQESARHICRRGSTLAAGSLLVPAGTPVAPEHLPLLAENGHHLLTVRRRPLVALLSSGSELVAPGTTPLPGQKVSGNGLLLHALVEKAGGRCHDLGTVIDRVEELTAALGRALESGADLIVTTGGMGPGRYDLMEEVFERLDGAIIYRSVAVRPGKATLFGYLAGRPFFALPGPPPAVRLLFQELVTPALRRLLGLRRVLPQTLTATLSDAIALRQRGVLNLKGGLLSPQADSFSVRPTQAHEAASAVILLPGRTQLFPAGSRVQVHLID